MKERMADMVTVLITLLLHSLINSGSGVSAQGQDHYCSRDPVESITGEVEGSIHTLYQGDGHYKNNQNCEWMIDAGPNNRVEITVVSSDLQWAPESAICPGYDHVAIKDVYSNSSTSTGENGEEESIILQWCGHTKPQGAVSSGRYVRVEFMSDKNNPYQYAGVSLRFKTFPSSECAPSWDSSSAGFCYKVVDKKMDWSSAQRECNTGGANLVSVASESEHDFLVQTYGSLTQIAWIGLNDIAKLGDYQWIDGNKFTVNRFGKGHAANQFHRCVVLHFKERDWETKDCEKYSSNPLCKSNRGSTTTIFPIPQENPDEGDSELPTGRIAAIALSVIALVVLLIVGYCVYRRVKAQKKKSTYMKGARTGATESPGRNEGAVALQPRPQETRRETEQPSAPPFEEHVMVNPDPQMVAPPAYDEIMSHPIVGQPHRPEYAKSAF